MHHTLSCVVYITSTVFAYVTWVSIPPSWVFSPLFLVINYSVFAVALAGLLSPVLLPKTSWEEWRYTLCMLFACGLMSLLTLVLMRLSMLPCRLSYGVLRPLSLLLLIQSFHDFLLAINPRVFRTSFFLSKIFIVSFWVIVLFRLDIPELQRDYPPDPNRFNEISEQLN